MIKPAARVALEAADPISRFVYRMRVGFDSPVPPMKLRARTGGRFIRPFVESGRNCALALQQALLGATGRQIYEFPSVLDFGCGCGRTILHWDTARFDKLAGCDVDVVSIDWLTRACPEVTCRPNQFDPPLPFSDGEFDLVYSVSIFSHLSCSDQQLWLEELLRVTPSGGYAAITTQGYHAVNRFRDMGGPRWLQQWGDHDLETEGLVYLPYQHFRAGEGMTPGIKSDRREVTYGLTFISPEYMNTRWASGWEVIRLDEGTVDDLQDVVVLRKP